MPRVLISGYYGFDNVGDDTVLFGILTSLRKQHSKIEFAVLSNQPERTAELFGIPAYNRWSGWTIFRQLLRADLLVMGGGTLLQDVTSTRSIVYYLGIVWIAKLLRKPVVFFAQGFGPVKRPFSKRLIPRFVNRVDLITVRDDKSRDDFLSFGVVKPTIEVTADPALSIDSAEFPREHGQAILERFGVNCGSPEGPLRIGVAIRDWNTPYPYPQVLAGVLDQLARQGHQVVFIPMQYPRDIHASEGVAVQMKEKSILLDAQFSFRDVSSLIANFDLIVGMRLHSLILAAVFEVPFVSLSYDPKIDRFVQRMGLTPAAHVTRLDGESLLRQITDCIENLAERRAQMRSRVEDLRAEAQKSAIAAAAFLRKKEDE